MKDSGKKNKISNGNKHRIGKTARQDDMIAEKLLSSKKQIIMRLLESDDFYQFLGDSSRSGAGTYKEKCERAVKLAEKNKEYLAHLAVDTMIFQLSEIRPHRKAFFELCRPLLLRWALNGEKLDDSYYEELKK